MVLEDPVTPDNYDTMAEVAAKIGVPIATGERFTSLREFEVLMSRHAAQYVRPDVCAIGGITTAKKVAAIAEAHDVLVIPHNPLGPVSTAACLQICREHPKPWDPGTSGILPKRTGRRDGERTVKIQGRLHGNSVRTWNRCGTRGKCVRSSIRFMSAEAMPQNGILTDPSKTCKIQNSPPIIHFHIPYYRKSCPQWTAFSV